MMGFQNGCRQTSYPNSIATHDWILLFSVFIRIGHVHGFRIFCTQLKDIAHLDTTFNLNGLFTTAWTNPTFLDLGDIHILCLLQISGQI